MDRLEACLAIFGDPVSIRMDRAQFRCPSCRSRIPSMGCEAPACPLLAIVQRMAPSAEVRQRAEEIREQRRRDGLKVH